MHQLWRNISLLGLCIISVALFFVASHRTAVFDNRPIRPLFQHSSNPYPYLPYPQYNSVPWRRKWRGDYVSCKGPDDLYLNESFAHVAHARFARRDKPVSLVMGDTLASGIDTKVCFDSQSRLGPYGFAQSSQKVESNATQSHMEMDWSQVRWGELQDACLLSNKARYSPQARIVRTRPPTKALPANSHLLESNSDVYNFQRSFHPRTALLIRSWTGYNYTQDELQSIRALITELSLLSGGEYQVFLFLQVKDWNSAFWTDDNAYRRILNRHVPRELHDITVLWNGIMLKEWYPEVGDWQVYWHQFMPLQWFSKHHPEFDYVWNWEVDARCIGNHYHMLEQIAKFARKAPRKYLWERNARFYIPAAHGTYDDWVNDTHSIIESAMIPGNVEAVWGAQPCHLSEQQPIGPSPPSTMQEDDFEWGVGEEADLITLLPIWDPTNTSWTYRDKVFNYLPNIRPNFTPDDPLDINFHPPEYANISRRAYINTVSRFSKRQLHAMHIENLVGRTMAAEMWPATAALQHGLKAVYAPHPIWAPYDPPGEEVDAIFNADGGVTARWSAGPDSVYNQDREWRFRDFTWFFNALYPRRLYRRWLSSEQSTSNDGTNAGGGRGGLCLPQMLLHPVKDV